MAAQRVRKFAGLAPVLTLALAAAGCGGGGGGSASSTPTAAPATVSAADAARLLEQATIGVIQADVATVQSMGVSAYIDSQIALPPTQYTGFSYVPHTAPATCVTDPATPTDASSLCARDDYTIFQVQRQFFQHALGNPDQLRQRVAFALSQIFVVSSTEIYEAYGMADYQNLLLNDAFANYRTLLQDVTLSPVMGHYLDMVNNAKSNAALGTSPNENYGREVLQLFSIGLYQLNPDGTQVLDATGAPVPTYTQDVVEGFSSVFTGWTYPPLAGATSKFGNPTNYDGTMVAFQNEHDEGSKLLLDNLTVPANQTPAQDLQLALDNIFNHSNVGPFIGRQLIQHLVTSNPSPAYVARISAVFANDGTGVRGNLAAVVKAILMDSEARGDAPAAASFGHLREPALYITSVMRSMGGQSDGVYLASASSSMGQPIFSPQTVFNFYPPSYGIPGTPLLGPEFGIDNAATALARANFVDTMIMQNGAAANATVTGSTGSTISLAPLAASTDPGAQIQQLNQNLMHGSLSSQAAGVILNAANAAGSGDALAAARAASYLVLTSAQYQVER